MHSFISLETIVRQRKDMVSLTGFTLVELIIVAVIIGILATFALPQFATTKRFALDKEAKANLKLIRAAEKIYRIETNSYIAGANTSEVNTKLKLAIPVGLNWNYKVDSSDPANNFTGKAQRIADTARVWCITQAVEEPYQTGCTY